MTWNHAITFIPGNDWQCTEPTNAEYFRIRSINPPRAGRFLIAQVEFNEFNVTLENLADIPATSDYINIKIPKSPVMSNRRIGIIQIEDYNSKDWAIELWESDYVSLPSGGGSGEEPPGTNIQNFSKLPILADSPIFYWRLGDFSGSAILDTSPNNRGGILTANASLSGTSPSKDGMKGIVLPGGVRIYQAAQITIPGGNISIEMSFRSTSTGTNPLCEFNGGQEANSGSYSPTLYLNNGIPRFYSYPGGELIADQVAPLNDGSWHHIVATIGNAGKLIFVDGQVIASSSNSSMVSFGGFWHLGYTQLTGNAYFNGELQDFAIFHTQLNPERILAHANR